MRRCRTLLERGDAPEVTSGTDEAGVIEECADDPRVEQRRDEEGGDAHTKLGEGEALHVRIGSDRRRRRHMIEEAAMLVMQHDSSCSTISSVRANSAG